MKKRSLTVAASFACQQKHRHFFMQKRFLGYCVRVILISEYVSSRFAAAASQNQGKWVSFSPSTHFSPKAK